MLESEMTNSALYDVAVIGAGPVGSYIAYKLSKVGNRVIVLEQRDTIGEKLCCTGIISQECVKAFSIPSSVILRPINSVKLFSPSGDFVHLRREETQAYVINRPEFDCYLAAKAVSAGAEYRLKHHVLDLVCRDDKNIIRATCNNHSIKIESRAAVIASGFNSPLTGKTGLGQTGDFVAGVQVQVEAPSLEETEVYFSRNTAPGFFAWLVPYSEGKGLVGLLSRHTPGVYLEKFLAWLRSRNSIGADASKIYSGGIPLKPLKRTFADRLLAVGDAAGQVKPTTGGGIYFGLLAADLAVHTLNQSLKKDDLSSLSLSEYESKWRKKLGQELKLEYYARWLYERLSEKQINRVFEMVKNNSLDRTLLDSEVSFDWHGETILKAMKDHPASQAFKLFKLPW
jgi:digeranylgeranylglycerophospholipid reductase